MTTLEHELELVKEELAEALTDIERYERVAEGKYTSAELKDKGDPIQKLAQTYESLKAYQAQNQELHRNNVRLLDENVRLKSELAFLQAKGKKKEPETQEDKYDKIKQQFYAQMKKREEKDVMTFRYATTATDITAPVDRIGMQNWAQYVPNAPNPPEEQVENEDLGDPADD